MFLDICNNFTQILLYSMLYRGYLNILCTNTRISRLKKQKSFRWFVLYNQVYIKYTINIGKTDLHH